MRLGARILFSWALGALIGLTLLTGAASASITSVLDKATFNGAAIPCTADKTDGVRVCHGTDGYVAPSPPAAPGLPGPDLRFKGVGGTPLEVYVILPPASAGDGPFPLVVQNHGYGNQAAGPEIGKFVSGEYLGPSADALANDGFAVLQLTARGFGDSCGTLSDPGAQVNNLKDCTSGTPPTNQGYIRLDDDRYEARDVQNAVGYLVDQGIADPAKIGTTGESYGGGISMQLATLKDRVMGLDGKLSPWTSPTGTPLQFSAAAPVIPWSDLVYSLLPNGHPSDAGVSSPTADLSPIGVEKQSFVSGLFALGNKSGNYCQPTGSPSCSDADLTRWYADINAGEPYESNPDVPGIVDQIAHYHSAYYLLDGKYGYEQKQPPPLFIANGFTDDLFPVDEALRYENLVHSLYPNAPVSLYDWDGGHARGQNKKADNLLLAQRILSFLQFNLQNTGTAQPNFTALTQSCPASAPSSAPFEADSWAGLHPGEVAFSTKASKTILSGAGDPTISKTFDPIAGGGACATAPAADQTNGVATYRLPAATGAGYTLLGSPTVIANLSVTGTYPEIAMRLLDVDPASNTETLVARGVYRPDSAKPDGQQVFQLHPGAWHFAAGHIPKLELLGRDNPYLRASNGSFSITVNDLQLRLPVHETPDAGGTPAAVAAPMPPAVSHPSAPGGTAPGSSGGHPIPSCSTRPRVSIVKGSVHASRAGLLLSGIAGEAACPHAAASQKSRQHVTRVLVSIIRTQPNGRCRFVVGSGRISGVRPCNRPMTFTARGTSTWTLRLKLRIPQGTYLVRADAVDGTGRHARRSGGAVVTIRIR